MSVLTDYSPEEQLLLLRSLEAAAVVIAAASLGRKAETASEGIAAASYVLDSRGTYLDNTLIGSIQFELKRRAEAREPFPDFVKLASKPGAKEQALETLRQVSSLLSAKTTQEEAESFKTWLMNIAKQTSQAGKEGGNILGWGAVRVNDAEQAALQEVAQTLDIQQ